MEQNKSAGPEIVIRADSKTASRLKDDIADIGVREEIIRKEPVETDSEGVSR